MCTLSKNCASVCDLSVTGSENTLPHCAFHGLATVTPVAFHAKECEAIVNAEGFFPQKQVQQSTRRTHDFFYYFLLV